MSDAEHATDPFHWPAAEAAARLDSPAWDRARTLDLLLRVEARVGRDLGVVAEALAAERRFWGRFAGWRRRMRRAADGGTATGTRGRKCI